MSTNKTILRNRNGAEVAAIFLDEDSRRWRIVSKGETKIQARFRNAEGGVRYVAREFQR